MHHFSILFPNSYTAFHFYHFGSYTVGLSFLWFLHRLSSIFTVLTPFDILVHGSYTICHFNFPVRTPFVFMFILRFLHRLFHFMVLTPFIFILRFLHHLSSSFAVLIPLFFLLIRIPWSLLTDITSVFLPIMIYPTLILILMKVELSYPPA